MFYNCNPDRSNSECRSLPVFGELRNVPSGPSSVLFLFMCFIELSVLVFITIMVILMLRIFWKNNTYHVNMMNLFKYFVSHIFVYTISSMIILAFQTGFVEVSGNPGHIVDIILLFSSILRYYQLFGCVFMLATFLCERIAATLFITDYESHKKVHISIWLLLIVSICAMIISISVIFLSSDLMDWAVIGGSVVIVSITFILSVLLYYRNHRLAEVLESKTDLYSLSVRFQLKENFRAFKLLRDITLSCTVGLVFSALFIAIAVIYRQNKNIEALFGQAFNVLHTISILSALLQAVWSQPKWKRQFKTLLGFQENSENVPVPLNAEAVSTAYFESLTASWNKKMK